MPWFRLDDSFWSHPKVVELSADAVALWVRAASYAAQHLTDGRITRGTVRMLGATPAAADELVNGGMWEVADDRTWVFHDWFNYQPSAEYTTNVRAARSAAGRKGADSRWGRTDSKSHGKSHGKAHDESMTPAIGTASGDEWQTDAPYPYPYPDTSKEVSPTSEVAHATPRPDVSRLLDLLESEINANGGKSPTRSKKNIDAARLLLDKDGRPAPEVEAVIRWCQADEFWRSNILSMSKLREKYDQLRLAAQRPKQHGGAAAPTRTEENMAFLQRLAARDTAEERKEITTRDVPRQPSRTCDRHGHWAHDEPCDNCRRDREAHDGKQHSTLSGPRR